MESLLKSKAAAWLILGSVLIFPGTVDAATNAPGLFKAPPLLSLM